MLSGSACSRRMLGVALGIGVLLALVGCTATEGCGECQPPTESQERPRTGHGILVTSPLFPVAPQELVPQLLQRLEGSVNLEEAANPSVLLAMNLAGGDSEGPIHKWLLQEIKEEAVRRAQKGRGAKEGRHLLLGAQVSASSWGAQPSTPRLPSCPHRHDLGTGGSARPRPPLLLPGPPACPCPGADPRPDPYPAAENR